MDLVDAITQWVDHIDEELAEDDRAAIARVQRALDAGEWGQVDVDDLDTPSVSSIKSSLVGVDADEFIAWIVDGALARPDVNSDPSTPAQPSQPVAKKSAKKKKAKTKKPPTKTSGAAFGAALSEPEPAPQVTQPPSGIFAAAATADLAEEPLLTEDSLSGSFAAAWLDSDTTLEPTERTEQADAFFADLDRSTTTTVTGPAAVELRDGDVLGPAFLPSTGPKPWMRIGVFAVAAVAIAAFVFAGWQLVSQVDDPDEDDVELVDEADASTPEADAEPSSADDEASTDEDSTDEAPDDGDATNDDDATSPSGDDAEADSDDDSSTNTAAAGPTATATPGPLLQAETTAIILTEAGDVFAVDLLAGEIGTPRSLYSGSADIPATDIGEVDEGITVVDDDGDVLLLDVVQAGLRTKLWSSDDEFGARAVADVGDRYAVLDRTGSIQLVDKDDAASGDAEPELLWDTAIGGTPPVGSMGSFKHLLAFSVQNGDVHMLVTGDDQPDQLLQLWSSETQPRASNIEINAHGVHMGVGGGAVARYNLLDYDGPPLIAMWDPLDGTTLPAINYGGAGDRAAVVLNNGSVALASPDGESSLMWDAELGDLRAVDVTATEDEAVLTLDGGTVLRVALAGESEALGSIWDVSDESTSPAIKVLLIED